MDLGILLLQLENAIAGYEIYLQFNPGETDDRRTLQLLKACREVISRIEVVEE